MFQPIHRLICVPAIACSVLPAVASGEVLSQEGGNEGSNGSNVAGPPRITAEMIPRPPGEIVTVKNSPRSAEDHSLHYLRGPKSDHSVFSVTFHF